MTGHACINYKYRNTSNKVDTLTSTLNAEWIKSFDHIFCAAGSKVKVSGAGKLSTGSVLQPVVSDS